MGKKLYVGNLSFQTSEDDLNNIFSEFGNVESAKIITDRDTGRSKGFGFVEMSSDDEAQAAIEGMNEKDLHGRKLTVNEAKPMEPRSGGNGGGGFRGGSRDNNRGGGFGGGRDRY
jgi:cold-inducible RNA-binding protein